MIRETPDGATRLVLRTRVSLHGAARPFGFALEVGSLLIERKLVREIKRRAESTAWSHLPVVEPAAEEANEAELPLSV